MTAESPLASVAAGSVRRLVVDADLLARLALPLRVHVPGGRIANQQCRKVNGPPFRLELLDPLGDLPAQRRGMRRPVDDVRCRCLDVAPLAGHAGEGRRGGGNFKGRGSKVTCAFIAMKGSKRP